MLKQALRWLMALGLVAAGVNHFVNPEFYVAIMPPYVPWHFAMVVVSGIAETALGVAVLVPTLRAAAGWGIVALLIAIFPANVHMAIAEPGAYDAPAWGLWLRLPIQGLFIAWAWWCTRPDEDA